MKESDAVGRIITALTQAEIALGDHSQVQVSEQWLNIAKTWIHLLQEIDISEESQEADEDAEEDEDFEDFEDLDEDELDDALAELLEEEGANNTSEQAEEEDDGLGDDPDDIRRLGPIEPLT